MSFRGNKVLTKFYLFFVHYNLLQCGYNEFSILTIHYNQLFFIGSTSISWTQIVQVSIAFYLTDIEAYIFCFLWCLIINATMNSFAIIPAFNILKQSYSCRVLI